MKLYGAVDLHSNNSYVAISDEKDQVIEHKRLPNDLGEIDRFFGPHKNKLSDIVVESTFNGYWLLDGLKEKGYGVKLAHMMGCAPYVGLRYGDDKSDSLWLNRMNRLGVLPAGYIYPQAERPIRDLLRRRMYLIQTRTGLWNNLKHLSYTLNTTPLRRQLLVNTGDSPEVENLFSDPFSKISADSLLGTIQTINKKISLIESLIRKQTKTDPVVERLLKVRGIGFILAWVIRFETGPIERFKTDKNFLSYCGLTPTTRISNQKKKGSPSQRSHNHYLRWAFAEMVVTSFRIPVVRRYHDRLVKKKGKIKAKAIISSKFARIVYRIMKEPDFIYDQAKLFGVYTDKPKQEIT